MKNDFSNAQFPNATIGISETGDVNQGSNVNVYKVTNQQGLDTTVLEIRQMLDQLMVAYPIQTEVEQQVAAKLALTEINAKPQLRKRIISAIQAGTHETLKELIDRPIFNIVLAMVDDWRQ